MISLIFDTETTGFFKMKEPANHPGQAHIVELAFQLYCSDRDEVMSDYSVIVDPGVHVPDVVAEIHGLTTEVVQKYGIKPLTAFSAFNQALKKADRVVCHNTAFDMFAMQVEYTRLGQSVENLVTANTLCTMKSSTDILKLEPRRFGKYKWPSLQEAYKFFVDEKGFESAHRAKYDVAATVEVMKALDSRI